jgi:aspartate carbamoyltransferase catalytic subunit
LPLLSPQQARLPGSLLGVEDLSLSEISGILASASELTAEDPLLRARRFAKRRLALLFYESSTRTRTSFELAAKSLGVDTTLVSSKSSSIEKGESLKDTGITLRALGAEAIILRHGSSGSPWLLEKVTGLPVLNAGDGMHQHPSQALLDLRTMLRVLRDGTSEVNETTLAGVTMRCCCLVWGRAWSSADPSRCCRILRPTSAPALRSSATSTRRWPLLRS